MKKLGLILAAILFICATTDKITDCTYKGKKLHGRVRVVDFNPDFKVRIVDANEDLKVRVRDGVASLCGDWVFTNGVADFTVQFVDFNPDFTIRIVSYP
jgi:hypothetical protein